MGNQEVETGPTEVAVVPSQKTKASYSVIPYLGRDLPETYRNMVLSKWLRTLRFGNDFFKLIESDAYFSWYQTYIKGVLARPRCIVRLAVLSDEPDTCLGFSVSELDALHYLWSHKDNRRIGVANSLTQFPFRFITHLTRDGMILWNKKFKKAHFNPFI